MKHDLRSFVKKSQNGDFVVQTHWFESYVFNLKLKFDYTCMFNIIISLYSFLSTFLVNHRVNTC